MRRFVGPFVGMLSLVAAVAGGSMFVSAATQIDQLGSDIDGEAAGDESGYAVSLSSDGTIVAIGAPYNDGNGSNAGHVRVYEWDGASWAQKGGDIGGETAGDYSGISVSLSSDGMTVAIGAHYNYDTALYAGHVRVYEWAGADWAQKGGDIDGEAFGDGSGESVALSSDGTSVAIGAPRNGGGGTNAGHVRVFGWDGTGWAQKGGDIDGEVAEDESGSSVSLSSDGTIVAISAKQNDGTDNRAGHVRVYEWDGANWNQLGPDIDGEARDDCSG